MTYWYEEFKTISKTDYFYTDNQRLFEVYLKITTTKNSLRYYHYIKTNNHILMHKYIFLSHQETISKFPEEFI